MFDNPCVYEHCYEYNLNLVSVAISVRVSILGHTFDLLKAIYSFQALSVLHQRKFIDTQIELYPRQQVLKIPLQGDTCWVCKYKVVNYFQKSFASTKAAPENLLKSSKNEGAHARGPLSQFCDFNIVLVLKLFSDIL